MWGAARAEVSTKRERLISGHEGNPKGNVPNKKATSLAAVALQDPRIGLLASSGFLAGHAHNPTLLPAGLQQRLRRVDLLRFLQSFLGHVVLPRLICPAGHSLLYAKPSPNSSSIGRPRKYRLLLHMAFALEPEMFLQPGDRVELVISR